MSTQISIRANSELVDLFSMIANSTGRTRTYHINQAMKEYIDREAWQIAEIKEAIKEAGAGNFVSDNEMKEFWHKWAN